MQQQGHRIKIYRFSPADTADYRGKNLTKFVLSAGKNVIEYTLFKLKHHPLVPPVIPLLNIK